MSERKGMIKLERVLLIGTFIKLKFMWLILIYECKTRLFFRTKHWKTYGNGDIPKEKPCI